MKKTLLLTALCLGAIQANAQDESVFNRIHGITVKDEIYIKWDPSKNDGKGLFRYGVGNTNQWYDVDEDLIFNVKNEHKNNFKILTEFYNPLRYSIKSTSTDLDDPAYQALSQFFSNLPTTTQVPVVATAETQLMLADKRVSTEINKTILLHEWVYEFVKAVDKNALKRARSKSNNYNDLVEKLNQIKAADDYLFYTFSLEGTEQGEKAYNVNGWIRSRNEVLYAQENHYKKFKSELDTSKKVKALLSKKREEAVNARKAVIDLLTIGYDANIKELISAGRQDDFKKYSASTAFWLARNSQQQFDDHNKAIKNFSAFLKGLEQHVGKFRKEVCETNGKEANCNNYAEDYDMKLHWKSQKMKQFEYAVARLDTSGAEVAGSNFKGMFTVGKKLALYPYVSTGLLYTDFAYPNYAISTENGVNEVAEVGETKVNLRPTLFLNLIITNWDIVYPFMQLGITTGNNDALFPLGLGLSLGPSFSISGGGIFGYRKELDQLKVGAVVQDDAALQSDLTNKAAVSWYFSINYNLSKK